MPTLTAESKKMYQRRDKIIIDKHLSGMKPREIAEEMFMTSGAVAQVISLWRIAKKKEEVKEEVKNISNEGKVETTKKEDKKQVEYKLVGGLSNHLFIVNVNKAMEEGWQALGGVSVCHFIKTQDAHKESYLYHQAMVKYN
jgi:hypothetical protein